MKDDVFITRVGQLLADRNLTSQQLEQQAGLKPGALNLYSASERRPSADRLLAISRCLKTNPAYLMGYGDDSRPLKASERSFDRILSETVREQNWDLTELADECGVPRKTLVNYLKKGSKPSLEKVERIAAALKVNPAYLLGWQGEPEEETLPDTAEPQEPILSDEQPQPESEDLFAFEPEGDLNEEETVAFAALETLDQQPPETEEEFQLTSIFREEQPEPESDYYAVNEIAQLPEEKEEEFRLSSMFDEYPPQPETEDESSAGSYMALEALDEVEEDVMPADQYDHFVTDVTVDTQTLDLPIMVEEAEEEPVSTVTVTKPVEKVVYLNRGINLRDYRTENLIVMAVALVMSVLWFVLLLVQTERWKFDRLILFGFPMVMLLFCACIIIYFIIRRVDRAVDKGKKS
ncbi:MAG: helix-turn-helix domain-containing protein [Erysipelotrichaceae bacterium]|nr:helix-turn-helix domain-containing protein [Erysipelotrichaceae bacterium]